MKRYYRLSLHTMSAEDERHVRQIMRAVYGPKLAEALIVTEIPSPGATEQVLDAPLPESLRRRAC